MEKKTGIWIDKRAAKIFSITGAVEAFHTIISDIEEYRPKGGSGTRVKGGPQDVVQDSKYLEREKQQFRSFFKNIITQIEDADTLVIFGPAQTGAKLYNELSESYPQLHKKVVSVEKADSISDNQIKAWVKDYFT